MRITITTVTRYPKHGQRPPSCTAVAHPVGQVYSEPPRIVVAIPPRPGNHADEVAAILMLLAPFALEVPDDFFELDAGQTHDVILAAVRAAAAMARRRYDATPSRR